MKRIIAALLFVFCVSPLSAGDVTVRETASGYEVLVDGELYVGYLKDYKGTPILWPVVGPSGKKMTRDFPMVSRDDNSEAKDHQHHRSIWFTHGEVNDSDFWVMNKQKVVHKKFQKAESDGKKAIIVSENDWEGKDGKVLCSDVRTMRFGETGGDRYLDFDIKITAVADTVVFGDTKEGTFGIRVPGTMDVDAKKRNPEWGGSILNAKGDKDDSAWAKRSPWVAYSGPVEGETLTITAMNHPSSFRYPSYWHVRTYGLFAANPFGVHDFENTKEKTGNLEMKKGDSITLRYRVLFQEGKADPERIGKAFEDYSNISF